MKRRNGSLIYDRNDCRSEDLARVEIRLKQARIKYTLRCIDDVHKLKPHHLWCGRNLLV